MAKNNVFKNVGIERIYATSPALDRSLASLKKAQLKQRRAFAAYRLAVQIEALERRRDDATAKVARLNEAVEVETANYVAAVERGASSRGG